MYVPPLESPGSRQATWPKTLRRILLAMAGLIAAAELVAQVFGLGHPLLYSESALAGYEVQPDQDHLRFLNRVHVNHFGMRSPETSALPAPGTQRILCIGDSITFGGTQTPQDETYPYLTMDRLVQRGLHAEVLNGSAGGWAPDNELGWLEEHGTFGSQVIVFELGTHDLFQQSVPSSIVDHHPSFPSHAPSFGLEELVERYLWPRLADIMSEDPGVEDVGRNRADLERNMVTIAHMITLARRHGAQPVILHIEQPVGIEPTDPMTLEAKRRLRAFAASEHVPVVEPGEALAKAGNRSLFRDHMHPNPKGNAVVADVLSQALAPLIDQTASHP